MKPLPLGLALALLVTSVAAATASTITAPELQIMAAVNEARAANGLVPLRSDPRLWVLADERAAAMASADVLSHQVGGSLASGLSLRAIQWYGYGEAIAYSTATGSAAATHLFELWLTSPPALGAPGEQQVQLPGDRAVRIELRTYLWLDRADRVEGPDRRSRDADRRDGLGRRRALDLARVRRGPAVAHRGAARLRGSAADRPRQLGDRQHRYDEHGPIGRQSSAGPLVRPPGQGSRSCRERWPVVGRAPRLGAMTP